MIRPVRFALIRPGFIWPRWRSPSFQVVPQPITETAQLEEALAGTEVDIACKETMVGER